MGLTLSTSGDVRLDVASDNLGPILAERRATSMLCDVFAQIERMANQRVGIAPGVTKYDRKDKP